MSNAVIVKQRMDNVGMVFRQSETVNKITMALGFRSDDTNGKQKAYSFIASVLAEIEKSTLDDKKDLTTCEPMSLVQCAIDAAQMEIAIDARQHGHIVKELGRAVLRVGFRGYVSKITEHYPDADITAELVWEGDVLEIKSEDGFDHYMHERNSPWQGDPAKLVGAYVVMSYTKGERKFQHVTTMSNDDVKRIRGKAKFDGVWKEWFTEKVKVAAVKRASKITFAGVTGLQQLIRYDNAKNFQPLKALDAPKAGSIVDNINAGLTQNAEPETVQPPVVKEKTDAKIEANVICGRCSGKGSVPFKDASGEGVEPCPDCSGGAK